MRSKDRIQCRMHRPHRSERRMEPVLDDQPDLERSRRKISAFDRGNLQRNGKPGTLLLQMQTEFHLERQYLRCRHTSGRVYRPQIKRFVGKFRHHADLERLRMAADNSRTPRVGFKRRLRIYLQNQLQLEKRRMSGCDTTCRLRQQHTSCVRSVVEYRHNPDMERL